MKYLIHFSYLNIHGERVYDWTWTQENITKEQLLNEIESAKAYANTQGGFDSVRFDGIYEIENLKDISYGKDGSISL